MSVPLLLLVLLPALAQADNYGFGVEQPAHLSAPKGDTIHIPFSFYHHWESIDVSISWRRGHFHGKFFYNMTPLFIHEDYKDRLSLNWTKGQTKGYLRISDLRSEDENEYFCRIRINTQRHGVQQWQSIHGTTLTIISENLQPGARTTTQGPTTTASLLMDESSASGPLSLGAKVGVAVACAAFITAVLGLMLFLRCKRRKGSPSKTLRRNMRILGVKAVTHLNLAYLDSSQGQDTDPKLDHKDNGIVYASLVLSSPTSPEAPPCQPHHGSLQAETLYTVLKAK
ncbi:paired immunoglobulin-like type 2 receptor alpha isoform X5 [Loxodonta africana]|uniref:paired immunoglobulin-like type 2 receptor alpha isoform X5 n=1 Tax=Loxodonta africana TaxID=9785 RepID=UPI000C8109DD|nr:paired immunoglobulin-like type 2 receptor alpha isoform X4 [Loxodonta africana]